jgi:predicted O-linked N-acetylglucosamine transferase (SPINDLY family)
VSKAEQCLAEARAQLRQRDIPGAEMLLRDGLQHDPDNAAILHMLALLTGRAGNYGECVMLLERAIAHGSAEQQVASGLLLAGAHRRAGRLEQVEAAYRGVLAVAPASQDALNNLGILLLERGQHQAAVEMLQAAVAGDPVDAVAHAALAQALYGLGELAAAAESGQRAIALRPDDPNFIANLAVIRNAQGRFAEAATLCRDALALREEPKVLNTLGIALKEMGQLDESAEILETALALEPGFIDALYNLGGVRKDQGRTDDAIGLLRKVVRLAPDLASARFALCMAHLPPLYRDEAEVTRRRNGYAQELDALVERARRTGFDSLAQGVGAAQPFYLAYQGRNDHDLQRRYGGVVCRAMGEAFPPVPLAQAPRPGERLRIGIVCGHIRDHSVWRLPTRGWIENMDRSRFELIAYHTSALRDAETDRAQGLFDRFVQGPLPLELWRERLVTDRPHALIYPEIGMDPMAARLAAIRLAPVQYTSWGHPVTSGYPTIDYFISSAAMEPDDGDSHYSERLVRLPGLSTPMSVEPTLRKATVKTSDRPFVFWCGQSLYKFLPEHDWIFAAIAARVPDCRLVFLEFPHSPALTARFRNRLDAAFDRHGIAVQRHCFFLPQMDSSAYRRELAQADLVLDSIGWAGCNSLLEALAYGHPIVTCPGVTMRSRHGAALLNQLGLEELICSDPATYIECAVTLALDDAKRLAIRDVILAGLSRLTVLDAIPALERHIVTALQCGAKNTKFW